MSYLDYNATTPLRPEALEQMLPWLSARHGNPSSVHGAGQQARAAIERARESVAALIGASEAGEIVFTSGGSEADALAIVGAARAFGAGRGRVVYSSIEHDAVRLLSGELRRSGFVVDEAPCRASGVVDEDRFAAMISGNTSVASLMHSNNETGALQPVAVVAAAAKAAGALFHTDAVQSAGKIPLDVRALGADMLSLSAHKLGGPKGVGALYIRRGVRLSPLIAGHQEKNRRGGTENVAGIVGFGAACALAMRELAESSAHSLALRQRIEAAALRVPGATLNAAEVPRLPNTVHLSFIGLDGHQLVIALDLEGVAASSGPACSAGAAEGSHVLAAMGASDAASRGALRISVGRETTDADVDRLLAVLPGAVERLRSAAVAA